MKVQYGLALQAPIDQTILPVVIMVTNEVVGYIPIVSTEYNTGEFTEVAIGNGFYTIGSVTVPPRDRADYAHADQPAQYIAVLIEQNDMGRRPWLGITGFIPASNSGFASNWVAPAFGGATNRWSFGPLIGSLTMGMDKYGPSDSAIATPDPDVDSTASLSWTASLDVGVNRQCSFFDFNWVDLFNAEVTAGKLPTESIPLSLSVVSNPPGGKFVSGVLLNPVLIPEFGKIYNTVRIRRMSTDIDLGTYDFVFRIEHTVGGSRKHKDVTLTLTLQ